APSSCPEAIASRSTTVHPATVCSSCVRTGRSRRKSAGSKVTRTASSRRIRRMSKQFGRRAGALVALLSWALAALGAETGERHALWSLQGRTNTVYLLGSVHFLNKSEPLPKAIDEAYSEAEALLMELDMDDLDPLEVQQVTLELGVLPPDHSLESLLGSETYGRVAAKSRELGLDPTLLNRFRPWLAAMTLVQLHLMKLGLDPESGIEQRLTARAAEDGKPIHGLETLRQQLGMLASL